MARTPRTKRLQRHAQSLPACLRQFLTPAVWKQARRQLVGPRRPTRWDFHHLVLVVLAMTWSLGESTPERFAMWMNKHAFRKHLERMCRSMRKAREFDIAESTVKIHVQHILRKLNLSSRVQAAVFATEHGI